MSAVRLVVHDASTLNTGGALSVLDELLDSCARELPEVGHLVLTGQPRRSRAVAPRRWPSTVRGGRRGPLWGREQVCFRRKAR